MTARLFVRELDARGIDCHSALAAAGLTRQLVSDPLGQLSWTQCIRFIEVALELGAGDDLAVLAGGRAELSDLDLAGLYLRSTSSGREAFRFTRENREVLDPSSITHWYMTPSAAVIAVAEHTPTPAHAALAECVLASALKLTQEICAPVEPIEARFRHSRPADDRAHRRVFKSVRFDSHVDALFVPIEVVDRPLPHRDDTIRAVLEPHIARQRERAQAAFAADLPTRVIYGIREELAEGRTSVEALARRLRVSPRTLRRELSSRKTSYSDLLAQARRELAVRYVLASPRQSGPDIARLLGYADAHAFYRAFKRWTGVSLTEYRKHAGG